MAGPIIPDAERRTIADQLRSERQQDDIERREYRLRSYEMLNPATPDQSAEALNLGKKFGVPRQGIEADIDMWRQKDLAAQERLKRNASPRVMAWMDNSDNYAVAKDDVDLLGSMETFMYRMLADPLGTSSDAGRNTYRAGKAGVLSFMSTRADMDREQLEKAARYYEDYDAWQTREAARKERGKGGWYNRLGPKTITVGSVRLPFVGDFDPMPEPTDRLLNEAMSEGRSQWRALFGLPSREYGRDPQSVIVAVRPLIEDRMREAVTESERRSAEVAETMPGTGDFLADSLLAGVRSLTEMTPMIASALATRGRTIPAAVMGGQVYYGEYAEGRERELSIDSATERAILQAGVETVSERISLGIIDNVIKDKGNLALRFTKGLALEQGQEQVATMGGRLVDWAYLEPEKSLNQFIAETPRAMLETSLATFVASGGMQTTFLVADAVTQRIVKDSLDAQPSQSDQAMSDAIDAARESKLRARSPEKMQEAMESLARDLEGETVIVDLDGLAQAVEGSGLDVNEVLTQLGVPPDSLNESALVMGEIEMPTAKLLSSPAVETVSEALKANVRLKGETLTPAQKQAWNARAEEYTRQAADFIREQAETDATLMDQLQAVEERISADLEAAGFSESSQVNRANAVLASRMIAQIAARTNRTIEETMEADGPIIVGPQFGATESDLSQLRAAAVRVNGRVFTGRNHDEAREAAEQDTGETITDIRDFAGFVDDRGRFHARDSQEAAMSALAAGQVRDPAIRRVIEARARRGEGYALTSDVLDFDVDADTLAQQRRGGFSPSTRQLAFTEGRDPSTFMHEMMHWYLDRMEKLAEAGNAWAASEVAAVEEWYQSIRESDQMQAIRARYEVRAEDGEWRTVYQGAPIGPAYATQAEAEAAIDWRERHEALAESFEQYLQTGKAPIPKLVEIFRSFKAWLTSLYRGLLPGERASLSPEIQSVFDRMLTVDDEVEAAAAEVFRDAETMAREMFEKGIITERQLRMVGDRLLKAKEEVKEEMLSRAYEDNMRKQEAWWQKERERVKGDLARAFDISPVGRAYNWLAYGEWKGDNPVDPVSERASDAELFQRGTYEDAVVNAAISSAEKLTGSRYSSQEGIPDVSDLLSESGIDHDSDGDIEVDIPITAEIASYMTENEKSEISAYEYKQIDSSGYSDVFSGLDAIYSRLNSEDILIRFESFAIEDALEGGSDELGFVIVDPAALERIKRQSVAEIKTIKDAFEHPNHHVRAASFRALLDHAGVQYRTAGPEGVNSEYIYVSRPSGNEIKIRFSDHERQSVFHEKADYNFWNGNFPLKDYLDLVSDLRGSSQSDSSELFQSRYESVSESQRAAIAEFDQELWRIAEETEFDESMLDEPLEPLVEAWSARLEAAQVNEVDEGSEGRKARDAYYIPAMAELNAEFDRRVEASENWDVDEEIIDSWYEEESRRIEEEADTIESDVISELVELREASEANVSQLTRQRDAEISEATKRFQGMAEEQLEAHRERLITELADEYETRYGAQFLLSTDYVIYSEYDTRERFLLDENNQPKSLSKIIDDGLYQTYNPRNWGNTAPPANMAPIRLDLRVIREMYGDDAVRRLPASIRRRSSTTDAVSDMEAIIETTRKTLKKRAPQSISQFIMRRVNVDVGGNKRQRQWGIKNASDELRAMGMERLINEKSGLDIDYVRESVTEAGFLEPVDPTGETTINDLLAALDREARGESVVRASDAEKSAEIENARIWESWLNENGVDIYETDKKKLRASLEAVVVRADANLVTPDQAADMLGFQTGEELLRALSEVGNRNDFLNRETTRQMAAEFGDIMQDGTLQAEAMELARLDIAGRNNEIEMEALARSLGQQASSNYARQLAREAMSVRTVKEINAYERDLANERRFGKQALDAVQRGDYPAALKAKQSQLVAMHMYREGKKLSDRIEKQRRDLLRYTESEARRDKIADDYLDKIDALLESYELRATKQGNAEQRRRMSAREYVDWMLAEGREAEIAPEAMLLAELSQKERWQDMTADEVEYLVGTVKNIAHLGRTKQRLLNDQDKRQFNAIIDELVGTLQDAPTTKERDQSFTPTPLEATAKWLRKAHARLTRMEFQFIRLDGQENGPLFERLWKPFAEAANVETEMMRGAADRMNALYSMFTAAERNSLFHKRVDTPELGPQRGAGMTMMDIVTIGMNWGNAGNRQALIDGYGWSADNVEALLNRVLTDKHWDFIEGVWDLIGSYRDDAFALEKSITGVEPKAVEGIRFQLANGRQIEGKYYPLKYAPDAQSAISVRQQRLDESQALSDMGRTFTKPMTKTGHLVERVGSGGKPVKLSVGVFHEHIAAVIHDIAYRKAVIDAHRIIQNQAFTDAYIQASGREQYDMLRPWLAAIATERTEEPGGYVTELMRGARRNFSVMAMGYKLGTATQQLTGLLQGTTLIGTRYTAQGFFKAFAGGPASFWSAWEQVSKKSEFMRDRPMGFDRDVREVTNRIQRRTPLGAVHRNAFILIGMMDTAVSTSVWIGSYDKAMDGGVNGIVAGDEAAAIHYADSVVRRTQVAGRMQDLPQMMRGTEIEKLMTVVYSYFSGLYNMTAAQSIQVRTGQMNPLSFTANMMLLYVVIPVMAAFLAGRWPPEDEEEALSSGMKEVASNAVSTIPFFRDIMNAMINPQYGYQMSPAGSIIESGATGAAQIARGEGFESEFATKKSLELMGTLFGLPTSQLWITGQYTYHVATGEEDPLEDPLDAAREAFLRSER